MNLKYALMNPTGNKTILVTSTVTKKEYKEVAQILLKKEPTAEQVGFLAFAKDGSLTLSMAGGEFCGNATMSAAAYALIKKKAQSPVTLKVSGAKSKLAAEVWKDPTAPTYGAKVKMPAPKDITTVNVTLNGEKFLVPAVIFDGITHLILSGIGMAKKFAEKSIREWSKELGAQSLGLMFYDARKNKLKPLVYVQSPETLYWESSCGSGSVAVAAWLRSNGMKKEKYTFVEPGGAIGVSVKGRTYYLEGTVALEKEDTIEVVNKSAKSSGKPSEKEHIRAVLEKLDEQYGTEYICYLHHENAWQLLFATIMSAQCTDERVNIVTKDLYVKYPTLQSFADADLKELERDIHSTGFYHNKAKNIIACAKVLVEEYGGEVPSDIESLTALPGVGRKTANVIRGNIYHIDSIVVDTHVKRISNKLGFTKEDDPVKIEFDLMKKIPKDHWILVNIHLITLGRTICKAQNPNCSNCFLKDLCPSCRK